MQVLQWQVVHGWLGCSNKKRVQNGRSLGHELASSDCGLLKGVDECLLIIIHEHFLGPYHQVLAWHCWGVAICRSALGCVG